MLDLLQLRAARSTLLSGDDYAARSSPSTAVPPCGISAQPTVNVKLRDVLARETLPEMLLITTKCRVTVRL